MSSPMLPQASSDQIYTVLCYIAFDAKVPLQTLQMHGLWHSDAIWAYISSNTSLALEVPLTFQKLVNSLP